MTYIKWKDEVESYLNNLSASEKQKVFSYFAEMYADKRDAGISEEKIIEGFGAPYDVAKRILADSKSDSPATHENQNGEKVSGGNNYNYNYYNYNYGGAPSDYGGTKNERNEKADPADVDVSDIDMPLPEGTPKIKENKQKRKGKKVAKVLLTIGIIAVILGIAIIVLCGVFGKKITYTDEIFRSENLVERLELDVAAGSTNVEFYDGDVVEISYQAHPKYGFTARQDGSTVKLGHGNGWFSFGINWWSKAPTATVKIPYTLVVDLDISIGAGTVKVQSGEFKKLTMEVSAGTLSLGETVCSTTSCNVSAGTVKLGGLTCDKTVCEVSAGTVKFSNVNCPLVDLDVSAGTIEFSMIGDKSEYTIWVDKSAGSCNVSNQQGTSADKKIDIDVSAGTVKVNFN